MLRILCLSLIVFSQYLGHTSTFSGEYPVDIVVDREVESLRAKEMADFSTALEVALAQNPKWSSLIRQKKMAVSLVDMRTNTRLAHVNGDHMMYAASLPKIAVLLAAADALDKGELQETAEIRSDMRQMIARSNNQATTRMIDRLGFAKIESVLTDPAYKLYDPTFGGGLWVGKRYGSGGGRHPDPMKGLSHAATTNQVARFYYLLSQKLLVNESRSEQMLRILANPELHHKFVNTLDRIAPQATVYRKSGSWRTYHSDSVMVSGPDRNYILVALIDDAEGEQICRQLVSTVEQVLQNGQS